VLFLGSTNRNSSICKDRDAVVGRTAKIFNVVHGMRDVPTFMMNPLHKKGFIKDCSTGRFLSQMSSKTKCFKSSELFTLMHVQFLQIFAWCKNTQDFKNFRKSQAPKPVVPKIWVVGQKWVAKDQKWISPGRCKPGLYTFTVTIACLYLPVV